LLSRIASRRLMWRSVGMFREVSVIEVREILRAWMAGLGFRTVAALMWVDRKTVRRYVDAVEAAGLIVTAESST
jgi:predicted DNA-binding transcriptional regulator YafY